jgi:hypothetical protein
MRRNAWFVDFPCKVQSREGCTLEEMEFRELVRYERVDETRIYSLVLAPVGVELWRLTESPEQPTQSLKEADLASVEELIELLDEIGQSLRAAGWTEVTGS